jgi:hypothetical protein
MKTVVRAAFQQTGQVAQKNANLNQDLTGISKYSLLESEHQAANVRRLIWNAAGYL